MQKINRQKVNIELFEDFMNKNNLSLNQFCKLCGISPKAFYNMKKGKNTRLITIVKIAIVTKIRVDDMLFLNIK